MKFTKAIVKTPGKSMDQGISSNQLGKPDHQKALIQHQAYVAALEKCGLSVTTLEPSEDLPDSVFVEDTALLTSKCAVVTNPGAPSRNAEPMKIEPAFHGYYSEIFRIVAPGTLDAGDVMMAGTHFFIGVSDRTNREGAEQLADILKKFSFTSTILDVGDALHLKTSVSYVENNVLLATAVMANRPEFQSYDILLIPDEECYAANSLWINDTVLVPAGFPKTLGAIESAGFRTCVLEMSEFMKLDGGLSCLSLRF